MQYLRAPLHCVGVGALCRGRIGSGSSGLLDPAPDRCHTGAMPRFGLRLDAELYEKARAGAQAEQRSMNWWIANLIRQAPIPSPQPKEQP